MEQSARANRRLGSLAISRLAGGGESDGGGLIPIASHDGERVAETRPKNMRVDG
ncbi:MAG TPA: hypothetical protein VGH22_07785 [Candidatus Binatia bacterium]